MSHIPYILRQCYNLNENTKGYLFTFYFRSTHSFHFILLFFLQFFFSFHITFLYSFSELLYKFIADFALFKTVLEGMYLWAGPEWLILHESRAQTVLLSNVILFSVTIFRTMLNTLSDVFVPLARACGWGISRADIHHSFPRVSEMLKSQLQNLKKRVTVPHPAPLQKSKFAAIDRGIYMRVLFFGRSAFLSYLS